MFSGAVLNKRRSDPKAGSDAEGIISKKKLSKKKLSKKKLSKKLRDAANGAVAEKTKPAATIRAYESPVFVCPGGDCTKRGAPDTSGEKNTSTRQEIRKAFRCELRPEGLLGEVRIDTVNCLGLCKHGPNVVVYDGVGPEGTWYLGLGESDVPEVVEQHLRRGEPVERLEADRSPGKMKKARK